MEIEIKPVGVYPEKATKIRFDTVIVVPRDYARGTYVLLNDENRILVTGDVAMTHQQYVNWGTEDTYLENCFLNNLEIERV